MPIIDTDSQTDSQTDAQMPNNPWQMTDADGLRLLQNNVSLPMGYAQLKHYLPHRYPFMLVDKVTSCRPDSHIIGYKNVSINEPFFQGHFPDNPIMPGVLIIEAMAQLSGILGFISEGATSAEGYLFLFAGMDKVRFKQPVVSGDCVQLKSELILHKHEVYKFASEAYVEGTMVASAQLTLVRQVCHVTA